MRLAAGQIIETTERFRQFQPVAQTHIKICDWLTRARTLDDLDALAAGEVARSEIVSVLTLFFERSFLVFKQLTPARAAPRMAFTMRSASHHMGAADGAAFTSRRRRSCVYCAPVPGCALEQSQQLAVALSPRSASPSRWSCPD